MSFDKLPFAVQTGCFKIELIMSYQIKKIMRCYCEANINQNFSILHRWQWNQSGIWQVIESTSYKYEINNHFAHGSLCWHIYDNGQSNNKIIHNFSPDFKRFSKIDAKLHMWLLKNFSAIKIPLAFTTSSFDDNDRDKLLSPSATRGLDSGEFLYQCLFWSWP